MKRVAALFSAAATLAAFAFVGGLALHQNVRTAEAACQPTSFTAIKEKNVAFYDTFWNADRDAYFTVYYGRCSSGGNTYIQFASETDYALDASPASTAAADLWVYLCPTSGCQNIWSGGAYSSTANTPLYEDSPILNDTSAGQKWCVYTSWKSGVSYLTSIWWDGSPPTPVTSGSWENCGVF